MKNARLTTKPETLFYPGFKRYCRFGLVGASGIVVDMGTLFLLADPRMCGLGLTLSKLLAAETAIVNNYVWNDKWTFYDISMLQSSWQLRISRFFRFNVICLAGIAISVSLLNTQVYLMHMNIYLANMIAIIAASLWNFWMNLKFSWVTRPRK